MGMMKLSAVRTFCASRGGRVAIAALLAVVVASGLVYLAGQLGGANERRELATDDTYVLVGHPDLTNGTSPELVAGGLAEDWFRSGAGAAPAPGDGTDSAIAYIKFRVGALRAGRVPARAEVHLTRGEGPLPETVELTRVGTAWSERTLSARTAPRLGDVVATVHPAAGSREVVFDVTRQITAAGSYAFAVTTPDNHLTVLSKERKAAPTLVLKWTDGRGARGKATPDGPSARGVLPLPPSAPVAEAPVAEAPAADGPVADDPVAAGPAVDVPAPIELPGLPTLPTVTLPPLPTVSVPGVPLPPRPTVTIPTLPTVTLPPLPTAGLTPLPPLPPFPPLPTVTPAGTPIADPPSDPPSEIPSPTPTETPTEMPTETPTATPSPSDSPQEPANPRCVTGAELVPTCGVLWGVAPAALTATPRIRALHDFEAKTGRTQAIFHAYHRGTAEMFPTADEIRIAREPGKERLLFLNWKPTGNWAEIAAGRDPRVDGYLDGLAEYISKVFPDPFFLTVYHEAEDNVRPEPGSGYTAQDYAAMYRHVIERLRAGGATNVVSVWVSMAYVPWNTKPWFGDMYPGDDVVDWVAWDVYAYSDPGYGYGDFAEMVNRRKSDEPNWPGFYSWAAERFPDKPLMVAEWGVWYSDRNPGHKASFYDSVAEQIELFPRIKALVYFDTPSDQDHRDSRVDSTPEALAAYQRLSALDVFRVDLR